MLETAVRLLLKLVAFFSEKAAANILIYLVSRPRRLPMKEKWRAELKHAQRLEFKQNGARIGARAAWQWGSPTGKLVVCVHGWEGTGAQFGFIAKTLADQGYHCVAIDLTAHGASDSRRAEFADFPRDICALAMHLNKPVYAYICHSAGGMLVMGGRATNNISAEKYVCFVSPSSPYPPVAALHKAFAPSANILEQLKSYIASNFDASWETLLQGYLYSHNTEGELLLIYNKADKVIDHQQGDLIYKLWPGSTLIKVDEMGHNAILWKTAVIDEIAAFLAKS